MTEIKKLPRPTTIEKWGRIFTDVSVWHHAVAKIMASEGLGFTSITAGFPGSNAVFLADGAYVIKIFAPMFEADYAKELAVYRALAGRSEVAAPSLIAHGYYNDGNSWPYLITSYCPGVAIRDVRSEMSQPQLLSVAEQLGKMINALHRIPVSYTDISPDFRDRISAALFAIREKAFLAPEVICALEELLGSTPANLNEAEAILIHGDLTQDHLLLTKHGDKWSISALIDFADSEISPRECEWVPLWFDLFGSNAQAFHTFMRSYNSEQRLDEKWRDQVFVMTFLHPYGVPIVANALGERAKGLRSLDDLKEALWPRSLFCNHYL